MRCPSRDLWLTQEVRGYRREKEIAMRPTSGRLWWSGQVGYCVAGGYGGDGEQETSRCNEQEVKPAFLCHRTSKQLWPGHSRNYCSSSFVG